MVSVKDKDKTLKCVANVNFEDLSMGGATVEHHKCAPKTAFKQVQCQAVSFYRSIYLALSLSQSKSIPLSFLPLSLPMLHCVQGRETEIFARMEIGLTRKGLGFAVDRPTDDLLVQSITKRAMAGMMFHSEFSKLPGSHAGVI